MKEIKIIISSLCATVQKPLILCMFTLPSTYPLNLLVINNEDMLSNQLSPH
jgi:hypothetical protein